MVTGKSNLDYTGRRNHARGKKKGRRDHNHETQPPVVPEDDDSSDLSDDSDEESESLHRYVAGSLTDRFACHRFGREPLTVLGPLILMRSNFIKCPYAGTEPIPLLFDRPNSENDQRL